MQMVLTGIWEGKKKKKAGFSKSRFLYYFDFMALPNDSDSYF